MNIQKIDMQSPEWFHFVENHPDSNIFHHPAWAGLIADCYQYEPFVLAGFDEAGQVVVGIPFLGVDSWLTGSRWVSLPFSDHCLPLYHDPEAYAALIEHIVSLYAQKSIPRVEIRARIPKRETVHENNAFVWHTVKLTADPDSLLRTFHKTRVRDKIRQAADRGTKVYVRNSKADMHIFYDLLVRTHRRLGVPVQSKHFFDLFWSQLIANGYGFLMLAYYGKEPVAGTVFLHYKGILTAKYNASLPEYWILKANNLIYWSAMKWGCENAFQVFDFGRTEAANATLRDYKSSWGTVERPLIYATIADQCPKHIEKTVSKYENFVIRNSPALVCRMVGELLYKHFA